MTQQEGRAGLDASVAQARPPGSPPQCSLQRKRRPGKGGGGHSPPKMHNWPDPETEFPVHTCPTAWTGTSGLSTPRSAGLGDTVLPELADTTSLAETCRAES